MRVATQWQRMAPVATGRRALPGLIAAGMTLAAALVRVAYLIADCPLELAADEAHYWDWSRHLDWSYYSKGPLVAWLIRGSCELFGGLSERLVGSPLLAIRLPAVLCQIATLAAMFTLTRKVTGSDRLALATLAVLLTMPAIAAGGTVMTIDAPYCCAWAWSCLLAHLAIFEGRRWAWPALGATLALGILAKYTMLVWLPGAALFLLTTPAYRPLLRKPGPWLAVSIAALACVPILVWNSRNGWVTFRHVGTQAGAGVSEWKWLGPLRYVTEQAGLLLIFWFLQWVGAMAANAPWTRADAPRKLLWWTSAPMFAVFLAVSLRTPGQINWPIAAYVGGIILAVEWAWVTCRAAGPLYRRLAVAGLATSTLAGLALTAALHLPVLARPLLAAVSGPPTPSQPAPMRKYDPTARLRGWRYLAAAVDELRAEIRAAGEPDPVIIASFWTLPGELAVYCDGHPEVYCVGTPLAQRMSQYDLWRPNPAWDPERFAGRTMIYVGDVAAPIERAFERLEPTRYVEYREAGRPIASWRVTVGRGYRGFGPPDVWAGRPRY